MNKQEALEYLASAQLNPRNEWTEAGMYSVMCGVINSDETSFDTELLDKLIERAEAN